MAELVFSPAQEAHDELVYLISERYQPDFPPEAMYGCTSDVARELIAADRYDDLLKAVLENSGFWSLGVTVCCARARIIPVVTLHWRWSTIA